MSDPEIGPDRLEQLAEALRILNDLRHRLGVDVCAYGSTDVEVGDGEYMRLLYKDDSYHLAEKFR